MELPRFWIWTFLLHVSVSHGHLLYGGPLEACIDKVIQAPTDPLKKGGVGLSETVITGGLSYGVLDGAKNEVNISALLMTMQEDREECRCELERAAFAKCAQQPCVRKLLLEYTSKHIYDLDGNGRTTCDDVAILLYVGHRYNGPPVSISCSLFWYFYRRNVAFLKHSEGVDINDIDIAPPILDENRIVNKKSPLQWTRGDGIETSSLRELDNDLVKCKNGQCKYGFTGRKIERCNGVVECSDNSDEQNCETCPKGTLTCLLSGEPTCLLETDICRFGPKQCKDEDGREISLSACAFSGILEKWEACKVFADDYWRERFGEFKYRNRPKTSFRQKICRGNSLPIAQNMNLEEALTIIPSSIRDFKFINYRQAICQDKVKTSQELQKLPYTSYLESQV